MGTYRKKEQNGRLYVTNHFDHFSLFEKKWSIYYGRFHFLEKWALSEVRFGRKKSEFNSVFFKKNLHYWPEWVKYPSKSDFFWGHFGKIEGGAFWQLILN